MEKPFLRIDLRKIDEQGRVSGLAIRVPVDRDAARNAFEQGLEKVLVHEYGASNMASDLIVTDMDES